MKTLTNIYLWLIVFGALMICLSCEENGGNSAPPIEENWDAKIVAFEVCSSLDDFILTSRSKNKTWNNETIEGKQGTITLDGSYEYEKYSYMYGYPDIYYIFNSLSVELDKFSMSTDDDAIIFTGTGTINGSIHEDVGSISSTFSGGWFLSCNLVIEGDYDDEISLQITFTEDSMVRDYSGTLTNSSGKSFPVTASF
jgi:hypothetical protein